MFWHFQSEVPINSVLLHKRQAFSKLVTPELTRFTTPIHFRQRRSHYACVCQRIRGVCDTVTRVVLVSVSLIMKLKWKAFLSHQHKFILNQCLFHQEFKMMTVFNKYWKEKKKFAEKAVRLWGGKSSCKIPFNFVWVNENFAVCLPPPGWATSSLAYLI